ncbi:MAG: phosphoenolpyruvate--protein phosphotransferase [Sphaerochaetaceae bacterium]|nr:phosphoenolpyruvate--protein phosphotransferase [Sphaerochaetaceae bacterium]MDD3162647.1 phosphoenolpyruvate--protein phosphotransferase [Sphaerochaetaceae bacterium]MDD4006915.1 phosphoenolpyruvate--protein phosphotransferase [Sphaerochaetaceae bacterium]MDD4396122.1 phosphoenolpyruvate--protein phosphotransferase [Sphaerochaetaceae bacterium]
MKLQGHPVSAGFAAGRILKYVPYCPKFEKTTIDKSRIKPEMKQFLDAREKAVFEINRIAALSTDDLSKVFKAHIMMLTDPDIEDEVNQEIESGKCFRWAICEVFERYEKQLASAGDPVLRERVNDMKDLQTRLLRCADCVPETSLSHLEPSTIVAASDLFPSDTAKIDKNSIAAILTENGGAASHTAIIARAYGIPAIAGIHDLLSSVSDGQSAAVDAQSGSVILDPSEEETEAIKAKAADLAQSRSDEKLFLDRAAATSDGKRIQILVNLGSTDDAVLSAAAFTDGAGLVRSEFLYMKSDSFPSEEVQMEQYRKVLQSFEGRPVTIRTLDIGGDKSLAYWNLPKEDNPFLGIRALRLCLKNPAVFKTQLRALLRASVYGQLRIMFPMVASIEDFTAAVSILSQCKDELKSEGIPFSGSIQTGLMIEIPSAAILADKFAKIADFASIGTNDLIQYALASDRMNPEMAPYYQQYNPAVFRLIDNSCKAFNGQGKDICVCGEMAGDVRGAAVLAGLGVTGLSMNATCVARIKKLICTHQASEFTALAESVLNCSSEREILGIFKKEGI